MSKDFDKGIFTKTPGWSIPPIKQALMHLFMDGRIMIVGRKGFQKIYGLPENFLPAEVNTDLPSRNEYLEHIVRRDIGSHGLIANKSIGHLLKMSMKEKQAILDKLIFRLSAVQKAQNSKYIILNVPDDKVAAVSAVLPGMKSPTIVPLATPGWSALHSVLSEEQFWEVIDDLRTNGAEGILVVPIEKMIV